MERFFVEGIYAHPFPEATKTYKNLYGTLEKSRLQFVEEFGQYNKPVQDKFMAVLGMVAGRQGTVDRKYILWKERDGKWASGTYTFPSKTYLYWGGSEGKVEMYETNVATSPNAVPWKEDFVGFEELRTLGDELIATELNVQDYSGSRDYWGNFGLIYAEFNVLIKGLERYLGDSKYSDAVAQYLSVSILSESQAVSIMGNESQGIKEAIGRFVDSIPKPFLGLARWDILPPAIPIDEGITYRKREGKAHIFIPREKRFVIAQLLQNGKIPLTKAEMNEVEDVNPADWFRAGFEIQNKLAKVLESKSNWTRPQI